MTSTPPPPPPPMRPNEVVEKPPVIAWLVPVAGVLALIGVFTPWFKPEVTVSGGGRTETQAVEDALYSWKEGKIGLIAPILLVLLAVAVVGLLSGRSVARFERGSSGPVVNAARGALIAGVVALGAVGIAWLLLPSQYSFVDGGKTYEWDDYIDAIKALDGVESADISRGPQLGLWLTIAAALVAIVGGLLMLVTRTKPEPAAPGAGFGGPGFGGSGFGTPPPPPPGSGPPQPGYAPPPPVGYAPPPQPGYAPPPQGGSGQPPAGYGQPPTGGYQSRPSGPPQG